MRDDETAIVPHIRDHAGETLQAGLIYDAENHRDLYRRDDIVALHDAALEAAVLDWFRSEPRPDSEAPAVEQQDDVRATVRLFERRVVLHLSWDAESGTIIVPDIPAAPQHSAFVADLRADLYRGSPG